MGKVWVRAPIEVDVTQVNKSWPSLRKRKTEYIPQYVIGFYQRIKESDNCRILKLPDNKPETIEKFVREGVQPGSIIYAEMLILPPELKKDYVIEELDAVNGEHVRGEIHINNIKTAWRHLKRNIKREYIHVSSHHIQGYCDEVSWKINNRNLTPSDQFNLLIQSVAGSRHLGYQELTSRNPKKKST